MDQLPIELIKLIFNNLSIKDLLNCRLLNKKFKYIAEEGTINQLIISDGVGIFKSSWFYTNEQIYGNKNIIKLNTFNRFDLITRLNKHLKRLIINYVHQKNDFNLIFLESFTNLQHLEIRDQLLGIQNVNLINLKILQIKYFKRKSKVKYILNTPKLEIIELRNFKSIEFLFPNNIKYLRTSTYHETINKFINLEIIKFSYLDNLNDNLLNIFLNLKQLHIFIETSLFNECYLEFKSSIDNLLKDKLKLKRSFELFFEGVQIDFDNLKTIKSNRLKFQLQNYSRLSDDLSFIQHFNYSELDCIPYQLPENFFQKFFNISFVKINNKIENSNNLNLVLNRIGRFHVLEFQNSQLLANYYEYLPSICEFRILRIDELLEFESIFGNWLDLSVELFINSRFLKNLSINFVNKGIKIGKICEDNYNLYYYVNEIDDQIFLNEIELYFDELCEMIFKLEKQEEMELEN